MNGKYFTFDGENSTEYNLMIAGIERISDVNLGLKRDILRGTFNRYKSRVGHMGATWAEPLTFQIELMKDACKHEYADAAMIFSEEELNEIAAWLTSPDYPTLFHMYDYFQEVNPTDSMIVVDFGEGSEHTYKFNAEGYKDQTYVVRQDWSFDRRVSEHGTGETPPAFKIQMGPGCVSFGADEDYIAAIKSVDVDGDTVTENTIRDDFEEYDVSQSYYIILNHKYDYFGVFENLEPQIIGGNIVGLTATFTTNSPFAWTPMITRETKTGDLSFFVNSAEKHREIYPVITIYPIPENDGDEMTKTEISITNTRDSLSMTLNLYQGVETVIDCEKCMIYYTSSVPGSETTIYTNIDSVLPLEDEWVNNVTINGGLMEIDLDKKHDEESSSTTTETGLSDTRHIYWPKLYYGFNEFKIDGNCIFTISYREARKVGEY